MQTAPLRRLGKTGVEVPAIGVGTNRWSFGSNDAPVFETYQALIDGGAWDLSRSTSTMCTSPSRSPT
jgi:aryl-alcohol dehydrogenase-like predicted oxidoreductase